MEGFDWGQTLLILKTLSVPLLLKVGQWLKRQGWFNNQAIPYAVLGVNGVMWVLTHMGAARWANGSVEAVGTPEELGIGALAAPGFALMAWSIKGIGGMILGTAVSLGVEQFIVNRAHKGIKYRVLYKGLEAIGAIPNSRELRRKSPW